MADQQFCLRWNNHQSTLISVFDTLLENGTLVDCTLAAEGQYLKAHKVVLSACSPYLETLLSQHYEKHPIVILKDVKFTELKSMMDYMYRGEVNISQDQLGTFLKAAESLQIKGLSDNAEGDARDVGSTPKGAPPPKRTAQPAPPVQPQRPESPAHRDGSISPSSRKRRRIRRGSQGEDSNMGDSHLDANSCDLPSQAQSTPIVPNIPSSISTTIKTPIVKPEQTELVNRIDTSNLNSLPPESGLLKEKIEPISEPLLEPKTEYLDDSINDDNVEDLTLDDDDDMDMSNMSSVSNMSRPGPSHGNDVSQGFAPWQLGGNQSGTDEVFMAAQEAVNAHRDSQGPEIKSPEAQADGSSPTRVPVSKYNFRPRVKGGQNICEQSKSDQSRMNKRDLKRMNKTHHHTETKLNTEDPIVGLHNKMAASEGVTDADVPRELEDPFMEDPLAAALSSEEKLSKLTSKQIHHPKKTVSSLYSRPTTTVKANTSRSGSLDERRVPTVKSPECTSVLKLRNLTHQLFYRMPLLEVHNETSHQTDSLNNEVPNVCNKASNDLQNVPRSKIRTMSPVERNVSEQIQNDANCLSQRKTEVSSCNSKTDTSKVSNLRNVDTPPDTSDSSKSIDNLTSKLSINTNTITSTERKTIVEDIWNSDDVSLSVMGPSRCDSEVVDEDSYFLIRPPCGTSPTLGSVQNQPCDEMNFKNNSFGSLFSDCNSQSMPTSCPTMENAGDVKLSSWGGSSGVEAHSGEDKSKCFANVQEVCDYCSKTFVSDKELERHNKYLHSYNNLFF